MYSGRSSSETLFFLAAAVVIMNRITSKAMTDARIILAFFSIIFLNQASLLAEFDDEFSCSLYS